MQQPYPVSRGELQRAAEKERFLKVERWGTGEEIISKELVVLGEVALLRGTEGSVSNLSSADQEIPTLTG